MRIWILATLLCVPLAAWADDADLTGRWRDRDWELVAKKQGGQVRFSYSRIADTALGFKKGDLSMEGTVQGSTFKGEIVVRKTDGTQRRMPVQLVLDASGKLLKGRIGQGSSVSQAYLKFERVEVIQFQDEQGKPIELVAGFSQPAPITP